MCVQHQQAQRKQERRYQHGKTSYGRPWGRVRDAWLAEHPLCVMCEAEGKIKVAEEVDHIIPHKGNHERMYDQTNLQSLCKSHHSAKTRAELLNGTADAHAYILTARQPQQRGNATPTTTTMAARYVVTGPPGCGKTTWVEQQRQASDMVWDLDAVAQTLCGAGVWPRPPAVLKILLQLRDAFIMALIRAPHIRAFVIDSNRQSAAAIAQRIGAQVVDIEHVRAQSTAQQVAVHPRGGV